MGGDAPRLFPSPLPFVFKFQIFKQNVLKSGKVYEVKGNERTGNERTTILYYYIYRLNLFLE